MHSYIKEFDNKGTYLESGFISNNIPTIFIHGVGLDNSMWYPQKEFFKNKPVVFYDILNHGKTKKKFDKLAFDDFSHQLDDLIKYLKITKINLVGFSIGALIAQHFTSINYNKINKLVLIGSVYKRSKKEIEIVRNRYNEALNGKSITKDSIKRWFSDIYLKKNPQVYDFFYELLENKEHKYFMPAYQLFVESDKKILDFTKFKMPTLIMTGENEIGSTPKMSQDLHKEILNSILYIIKDAKHGATIEKAIDVNNQLKKFLFN